MKRLSLLPNSDPRSKSPISDYHTQADLQKLTTVIGRLEENSTGCSSGSNGTTNNITGSSRITRPTPRAQLQAAYEKAHSLLLLCSLSLNQYLCAAARSTATSHPVRTSSLLAFEADSKCNEIVLHAHEMSLYRPVGAAQVLLCLAAVLAAARDATVRDQARKTITEYQMDWVGVEWSVYEERYMEKLRTLRRSGLCLLEKAKTGI